MSRPSGLGTARGLSRRRDIYGDVTRLIIEAGLSSGKTWDRAKLIQNFACGAVGWLVAADVMSLRVPLYFFGQATDRVADVFHIVARLIRDGLPDLFEKLGTGDVTVSDALYLALTVVLVGAGFVFLRRAWRALAVMRPSHWPGVPRLGWRGKMLAVLALGGAIALVWQYGDLLWLARRLVHSLWIAIKAAYANSDEVWQAVLTIYGSKEIIGQVAKGVLSAVATYVTVEVARVAVDFALSIIRFVLPIMSPVARYGYDGCKYARQWLPNIELTPSTIDWLHGTGSLAAGSIFGFENLSFPSVPSWLWVASVPGLLVFSSTRPNLLRRIWRTVCYVGRYLSHCVSIAGEYARSHPRAARDVAAGAMVALAGVGAFHAYSPLLAVMVLAGTLKVAYSAVTIALIVAAVRGSVSLAANVRRAGCEIIRRADTTVQKYFCPGPGSIFRTRVLTVESHSTTTRTRLPATNCGSCVGTLLLEVAAGEDGRHVA